MGLNNKTNLKSQASTIRHEDQEGLNTAERVGKVLEELIESADASLTTETNSRTQADNNLTQQLTIASNTATTAYNEAKDAKSKAVAAQNSASAAQSTADTAKATANAAKAVTDTKGAPNGIAPLDANAKVPAANLPGFVDDVVEFNAMVSGVTSQMVSISKSADDPGCMVVYDTDNDVFLLAVSKLAVADNSQWGTIKRPIKNLNSATPAVEGGTLQQQINVSDYWQIQNGGASLILTQFTYYNNWLGADAYGTGTAAGRVPEGGKIYTCTSDNKTFRWSGSELITIGSDLALGFTASTAFPGDRGKSVEDLAKGVRIFPFDATCYHPSSELSEWPAGTIAFCYDNHLFYQKNEDGTWSQYTPYLIQVNYKTIPRTDCIFRNGNVLYAMKLVEGSDYYVPEEYVIGKSEFDAIRSQVANIAIYPFDGIMPNKTGIQLPKNGIWFRSDGTTGRFSFFGEDSDTNTYIYNESRSVGGEEVLVARSDRMFRCGNELYRFDGKNLVKVGGASVGNTYNATVEIPLPTGEYYSDITSETQDHNVLQAVFDEGKASLGITITFAISQGSWKTYQYVGPNTTKEQFVENADNWIDLAGMSAGAEAVVNINYLCDNMAGEYNLSLAIKALLDKEDETKVIYRKPGMVLIYRTGSLQWEAKLFLGSNINDIKPTADSVDLWRDLGSGANKIDTKDTPEDGGKDALSTGGAYTHIPVNIRKDLETPGIVKLALTNADGDDVGDEIQFPVGTGTGDGGGTIVAINFEQSPFYAQAGGNVIIKASIISSTTVKGNEITNTIETVQLIDRTTKLVLETWRLYKPSSSSELLFDFEFDVSSYFTTAGSRDFQLKVTDDGGNVGTRNITVVAVDLTIRSEQTLNYTASTSLKAGENKAVTINCYSFPNFSTDIKAVEEIFIDGEWHTLGTTNVKSSHTNIISVNAMNCCGKVLTHGAYPIRVHGEDEKSGVVGSYLHSTLFVVDQTSNVPLIALRWISEDKDATIKMLQDLNVDYAVYLPGSNNANANIWYGVQGNEALVSERNVMSSVTYTFTTKVTDVKTDGSESVCVFVKSDSGNTGTSQVAKFKVDGTLLDISEVAGAIFDIEFSSRSNSEGSLDIEDNGVKMTVRNSNLSTNGFVKDSFGSDDYGTDNDNGVMTLRIAENVSATLEYAPYDDAAIETNGMALQFKTRFRNMAKDDAVLISCIENGNGFYMTGEKLVVTTDNGVTQSHTIEVMLKDDAEQDVIIIYEPTRIAPYSGIGIIRVFVDGDEAGACYYDAGTLTRHTKFIDFYGYQGELYLYNTKAWRSYFGFVQAFHSTLLRKKNVDEMLDEYDFNDVLAPTTAEGITTDRPQADKLEDRGLAILTVCKSVDTSDNMDDDQYPPFLETLDGDKKTKRLYDWYLRFPTRPWQDCVIYAMEETNQGTTSSWEKIKNIKGKSKNARVALLHSRDEFLGDSHALAMYDECAANAAKNRIQVYDDSIPTNIICIKVDIQDASGANNGAMMQMMNELQKGMGPDYMTPAQNAYTGKYNLNTSIDSIPVAYFRTDKYSPDATSPSHGYFHCKGNFNQDKGDAKVFGFEDVDGYNKGCLNYGDFIEHVAPRDTADFDSYATNLDKSEWEKQDKDGNDLIHMVSEFCGPKYHFFRFQNGAWRDTTGTMQCTNYGAVKQTKAKPIWKISGDVLNPVECIELRKYDGFCWLQGCNSVDDLLAQGEDGPVWLEYFESRYPDDDDLNALYKAGQKVPYKLYELLRWTQECNHNRTASDGNITINGSTYPGTPENRTMKYCRELHERANVKSVILYKVAIHYPCSADQESKNAMLAWYLDIDGKIRLYMNHMYDGDNQWGLGNNSAYTVPVDVNMDTDIGIYQGYDSVLFKCLTPSRELWLNDDGTETITVREVAKDMRACTLSNGVRPFSPAGIEKYWVTDRLSKWPKVVSSFDGERKYVKTATSTYNKIYGLHGLGINRLRQFVQKRFDLCDGYFGVGDIYSSVMKMRATGNNIKIRLKAAKPGYFGVGVDQAASAIDGKYLEAGETIELNTGVSNVAGGMLITIFGANKIEELDISEATPSQNNWDISQCILLKKLIIGGENWTGTTNSEGFLKTLNLGNKPFLEYVDIRGTHITQLNALYCPRIDTILAGGSELQTCSLAETSPISTMQLSNSMTALSFVNLPNLTDPGGLTIPSMSSVSQLILSGCPKIDPMSLINGIVTASNLHSLRLADVNVIAPSSILQAIKNSGAIGINPLGQAYDETGKCSGITGRWIMEDLISETQLSEFVAYFPQLTIYNSQYSCVCFDDTDDDCYNITNLDNGTSKEDYEPSGHFLRIFENAHPYKTTYDSREAKLRALQISDANYNLMADGTEYDPTDQAGEGFDIMLGFGLYWYKGVNDFKNQKKYLFSCSYTTKPLSTATKINRKKLSDILVQAFSCVYTSNNGTALANGDDYELTDNANMNVYQLDVEGMKQVRWPGLNNAQIGAVFVDADNKVVGTFNMAVSHSLFDFTYGDYVFCNVPSGAKKIVFTSPTGFDDLEAIAVDSAAIEAIEPDWVWVPMRFVGIYGMSVDALMRPRSISGVRTRTGTGTSVTNADWKYDSDGNITNASVPTSTMNYTYADILNLIEMRGKGYHGISYEISKDIANLVMALTGTRDIQAYAGYGLGSQYTTGQNSFNTYGKVTRKYSGSNIGNIIFGIQNFVGCNWEIMDLIAANVPSFAQFKKDHRVATSSYPIDAKYHVVRNYQTKEESVIQGLNMSGYCIGRVKFGRYCDIIASRLTTDNSKWNKNYSDCQYYTHDRGRCVGRSSNNAYANGGLVSSSANNASSYSYAYYGSRLAFSGNYEIVVTSESVASE